MNPIQFRHYRAWEAFMLMRRYVKYNRTKGNGEDMPQPVKRVKATTWY